MLFPKFIIEKDDKGLFMIIGRVNYHRQLARQTQEVKGGGMWDFDNEKNLFTLSGKSQDFGYTKLEDIQNCIDNNRVFKSKNKMINFSKNFKFRFIKEYGEIINFK